MRRLYLLLVSIFLATASLYAQERTITGVVTGAEDNGVLPGVNVVLKGTVTGVVTDVNGNYSLVVPGPDAVVVYSYIGYASQEVKVGDRSAIDVGLASSVSQLDEVVVTANAIERRKRELGYATTQFNNSDVTTGRDRSALNSIQGKVSGVQITNGGGSPGSSTRIVIRGGSSFTGNNQPLFVVDGIPVDNQSFGTGDNLNNQVDAGNPVNNLNPEDIESMTVLKGPAAAALYGERGSNGAVIITTKSGKSQAARGSKLEVNYTAGVTFEDILRLPKFQNEYGQGGRKLPDFRENFSWGPRFDGVVRPWGQEVDGQRRVKPYSALPDNVSNFFDVGRTLQHNLSLGGGNEKSNYYFSFGQLDNNGVVPNTGYKRNNFKISGATQLSNKFYSSASINYIKTRGDLSVQGQGNSFYDQVVQTPRDIPLRELRDVNNKFNDLNGYYSPYTINPYYFLNNDFYRNDVDRLLGVVTLGYKPFDGLNIYARVGTDVYSDQRRQITSIRNVTDPENSQYSAPFEGFYEETQRVVRETNADLIANYSKQISKDFSLKVIVGHNIRETGSNEVIGTANALVVPGFYNLDNVAGNPTTSNTRQLQRVYGTYADATVGFKDWLFLGLTGRNDFSSTLRKGANSYFYPAANVSFLFSEAFRTTFSERIFTLGKLRLNYARVGRGAEAYRLNTTYGRGTISDGFQNTDLNFPLNSVPGFVVNNRIGNPNLTPEFTTAYEAGLDLGFFNNRIGFEGSLYYKESTDQIFDVPLASTSGFSAYTLNAGSFTNQGIELLVRVTPIKTKDFEWTVSANYNRNLSKVVSLYGDVKQLIIGNSVTRATLVAAVGQPYGSFLVQAPLKDAQGRQIVDSTTGLPQQSPQTSLKGTIQPDWLGGITNTISYKGLTVSFTFDTRQGGYFYSRTKDIQEFVGTSPNTLLNDREPYVIPNTVVVNRDGALVPNTNVAADVQDLYTDQNITDVDIITATYVKLREVGVYYSLPKQVLKRTPFGTVTIGLTGRNLYLWTPKSNSYVDPEISSFGNGNTQGYDFGGIPSLRSIGGNVRFTF